MTKTGDMQAYHDLPRELKPAILALGVLIERIGTLPKADRDDLFDLLTTWRRAESDEDRIAIHEAMAEILAQEPIAIRQLPPKPEPDGLKKLQAWTAHIGKTIREFRDAAGMNQTELAEKAGLTQSHISRIENGQHRPNFFTLSKIANALGVEVGKIDPCVEE